MWKKGIVLVLVPALFAGMLNLSKRSLGTERERLKVISSPEEIVPVKCGAVKPVYSKRKRRFVDSIEDLLIKANPIPPSLVIAQAAAESGWGTSRFFVEGNNPFGIWTL